MPGPKKTPVYNVPGEGQVDPASGLEEGKSRSTKPQTFEQSIIPNYKQTPVWNVGDTTETGGTAQIGQRDYGQYEQGHLSENIGDKQQMFLTSTGMEGARQQRAELQSGWEQTGHAAARIVPKILLEVTEQAGYLFDLQSHFDTITGKGGDYSNAITEFAQAGKQTVDDFAPIYRENPNEVFDLSDPVWWISNAEGLVTSVAAFAVTGMGVGSVFGKGASMLAKGLKLGAKGEGLMMGAAQIGTGIELAYTEGAMSGAHVYKDTYDTAVGSGKSHQEAVQIASEAAATTVRLNTVLISGLNMTGAAAFIRPSTSVRKLKEVFGRQTGESLGAWRTRLATQEGTKPMVNKMLLEMGQESLEEVVNEVASGVGTFQGKKKSGTLTNEELSGGYMADVINTLGKSETGLAAILGAVGGGGQKFVTSFTKASKERAAQEKQHQQNQVSHLIARIESTEASQAKLQKAAETGDANMFEAAQYELFGQQAFASFVNGTSDAVAQIYDEIAQLTPEQAEAKGYSTKEGKDNYRTRATEASKDIKKLEKDYQKIVHSLNAYDDEARSVGYGEAAFLMHLNKYGYEKAISALNDSYSRLDGEHSRNLRNRGITNLTLIDAINASNSHEAANLALSKEEQELDEINTTDGRKNSGKQTLLSKYGHPPKGVSLKTHAVNTLMNRNEKLRLEAAEAAAKIINAKKEFLNAGNSVENFGEALESNAFEKQTLIETKAAITKHEKDLVALDKAYNEFTTEEGKKRFVKEKKDELTATINKNNKEKEDAAKKLKEEQEKAKIAAIAEKQRLKDEAEKQKQERIAAEAEAKRLAAEQALLNPVGQGTPPPPPGFNIVDPEKTEDEIAQELAEKEIAEKERLRLEEESKNELEDGEMRILSEKDRKGKEEAQEIELDESLSTSDFLIVSAADTIAYLSKPYEVDENGRKITTTNEKNPDHVLELESPTVFKYGTELTLEVDKSARWTDDKGVTKTYDDFVNPQTGEVDVNNVPIAIKDKNGRTVGYLRTVDWIERPYGPGYANVANDTDPESPVYENAKRQAARNIKIRNFVLQNGSVKTTISEKSPGILSKNMVNGTKTTDTMTSLTPGIDTITVVKKGQFHSGTNEVHTPEGGLINTKEFLSELSDKNGIVYIPIPSPNGGTLMIPTEIPTVSDNQSDVILHAMELFLSPGDPRAEFQEGDVFDLTSAEGVFDLISGITHIVSDSAASFEERVNAPGGNAKAVYLSLDKKTGIISIAKQDKQVIQIQSVADLQANKDLLKQLLMEKLFSVKLSMVNKSDATYEAVYNPETQSIDTVPHNNYNEYVKQHLKVDIVGTPIGNGEYSYFDQPVIQFATDFLREEKPVESKPEEVKEDEFINLIDKLESLVEKFKAEGQTEQEAKVSAFNELNETEKTELLSTQPIQQTAEVVKSALEIKTEAVEKAVEQAKDDTRLFLILFNGSTEIVTKKDLLTKFKNIGLIKKIESTSRSFLYYSDKNAEPTAREKTVAPVIDTKPDLETRSQGVTEQKLKEEQENTEITQIDEIFLTNAMVEFLDDKTKEPCIPLAKDGARSSKFTKGSQWEVNKDLKGYNSHKNGGINLAIDSKIKINAEGLELVLKNKAGDYAIVPKRYRLEVLDMVKEECHGCIDALIEKLPVI